MDFEEEFWPQTTASVPLNTEKDVFKYWNDRLENVSKRIFSQLIYFIKK